MWIFEGLLKNSEKVRFFIKKFVQFGTFKKFVQSVLNNYGLNQGNGQKIEEWMHLLSTYGVGGEGSHILTNQKL